MLYYGGQQEWLDAHVKQPGDATYRIIRVECAENEMARHRGADGDFGGFNIADFSHHDDVGILTQDGSQPVCKCQIDLRLYVYL